MLEATLQMPVSGVEQELEELDIHYDATPTIWQFHSCNEDIRAIVGEVGSGKTSGATIEICKLIPRQLYQWYGIKKTKWAVVRNTYVELMDTTYKTIEDWFPWGEWQAGRRIYTIITREEIDGVEVDLEIELLLRSCDRADDMKKFKSLEITGYWIDEANEVAENIKKMLKTRIGRFPKKCPMRFGIETTNPPDVEHPMYSQFKWLTPVPGPVPTVEPLENHAGFWQPPRENEANLTPGYYDKLRKDFANDPEWIAVYLDGKPGIMVQGKQVYNNFKREFHVATEPLVWSKGVLYRGWDNSGNCPACVVSQVPTAQQLQILREFHTDREGIVDFAGRVVLSCNLAFPDAEYIDYGDPAGAAQFSKKDGGFTSNKKLMEDACGIKVISSDQNFTARTQAVDQLLARRDGMLIDPSCTRLINGFISGYCYPEIGTNTGIYAEKPIKNKFSHPHDGLQYLAVKLFKSESAKSAKVDHAKLRGRQVTSMAHLVGQTVPGNEAGWMK